MCLYVLRYCTFIRVDIKRGSSGPVVMSLQIEVGVGPNYLMKEANNAFGKFYYSV